MFISSGYTSLLRNSLFIIHILNSNDSSYYIVNHFHNVVSVKEHLLFVDHRRHHAGFSLRHLTPSRIDSSPRTKVKEASAKLGENRGKYYARLIVISVCYRHKKAVDRIYRVTDSRQAFTGRFAQSVVLSNVTHSVRQRRTEILFI